MKIDEEKIEEKGGISGIENDVILISQGGLRSKEKTGEEAISSQRFEQHTEEENIEISI